MIAMDNKKKTSLLFAFALLASCAAKPLQNKLTQPERTPSSLQHGFCESAFVIQDKSASCDDNDKFVDAAEACLAKFEKGMKNSGIRIFTPDDVSQYNHKGGDGDDEAESIAAEKVTDYWIEKGNLAIGELKLYTEQLNYPEDAEDEEDEEENGSDPDKYAETVDCYGESKKSITDVADDFQYYLEQLEYLKKSQ